MRRRTEAVSIFIVGILSALGFFPVGAQANLRSTEEKSEHTKTIRLVVNASTWRIGQQPYDIAGEVKRKLEQEGFRVATTKVQPESASGPTVEAASLTAPEDDCTLSIDYREEKGSEYSNSTKTRKGTSTKIFCTIKLSRDKGVAVFEHNIGPEPHSFWVYLAKDSDITTALYSSALKYLQANPLYKYLGKIVRAELTKQDSLPIIASALGDRDSDTIKLTANILAGMGDKRAIGPLWSTLKSKTNKSNQTRRVLQHALRVLGWEPKDDTEKLYFHIGTYHLGEKEKQPITSMGTRAVGPLIAILNNQAYDWITRSNAARALGDISAKEAVDPLIGALQDKEFVVRRHAAEALGKIGDEEAVNPLLRVSQSDSDAGVRKAADQALKRIQESSERR